MRDISEQFHLGEKKLAGWIAKSFNTIKSLKDKIPFIDNHKDFEEESIFWTMGPLESKPGKYFVYWHSIKGGGSIKRELLSITIIPNTPYLMMFCYDLKWHKFDRNKSAWNWAKTMDLFLHGAYTDIPPISLPSIMDHIN